MKLYATGIPYLMLTGVTGFSMDLYAQSSPESKNFQSSLQPTKQNAVNRVKKQTGGRILDVKKLSPNFSGQEVWRVKFLKDGRIRYMDIVPQASTD